MEPIDGTLPPTPPTPPTPPSGSTPTGGIRIPVSIEEEMKSSFMDYAMSVIVSRALPDVRDGLKPVHRRILFGQHQMNNVWNRPYIKCARVVGEVLGKFHPHGDSACYDALVRLAQDFSMRYPLIDGQGNFGSIDGDPAAAYRYTECRMKKIGQELLSDIDKNTVDFQPNYDDKETEPTVLPTRLPNLLINGASGIAVGMATNIPPHNLGEIIDATIAIIRRPDIEVDELLDMSRLLHHKIVLHPEPLALFVDAFFVGELALGRQIAVLPRLGVPVLGVLLLVPLRTEFALHAPRYAGFALHPLVGWVAGIDLAMLGKATPKVFCGGPQPLGDATAVMRLKLPADRLAQIARETQQPFKAVVNETLRRGLAERAPSVPPFDYQAHAGHLLPGIDERRFNELAWQLDEERFGR